MRRGLISSYLCVGTGLAVGLYVGVFVIDYEPAVVGWVFGAGAGTSVGAFVAAMATSTSLVGSSAQRTHRGVISRSYAPDENPEDEEVEIPAPPSRNGHGGNGATPHQR